MDLRRIGRHLLATHWRLRRDFAPAVLEDIKAAIRDSEGQHAGQVRFVVESALHGSRLLHNQTAQQRAREIFAGLRMWDTEHRNGVLIYLLLADRAVEIVVDRGAHHRVDPQVWPRICRQMESEFRAGRFPEGVLSGIRAVTEALRGPFPGTGRSSGELPDAPLVI